MMLDMISVLHKWYTTNIAFLYLFFGEGCWDAGKGKRLCDGGGAGQVHLTASDETGDKFDIICSSQCKASWGEFQW